MLVGYGVKLGTTVRRTRKPAAQRSGPAAGAAGAATAAPQPGTAPARQVTQSSTGNNGATLAGAAGEPRAPCGAGQAAGPQAGQGLRRLPVRAGRHRPERLHYP